MTLSIRQLPCAKTQLMDPKQYPAGNVFFNPSADGDIVYIRATRHTSHDETNYALIHNTRTQKTHPVESPLDQLAPTVNMFKGLEDLRVVHFRGQLWFTATTTHASGHQNNEMVVGHFSADLARIERISPISAGKLPVKNICPFVWPSADAAPEDQRLRLIDTYKRVIYEVTELYEEADADASDAPAPFLRYLLTRVGTLRSATGIPDVGYRGSTSPVHLHGNTWGCVVHDIIFNDNARLVTRLAYYHHWMEMDLARGVVTYFSAPFWIAHWGIEYVSGLRRAPEGGAIELFFGLQDQLPMKCVARLSDLRAGK